MTAFPAVLAIMCAVVGAGETMKLVPAGGGPGGFGVDVTFSPLGLHVGAHGQGHDGSLSGASYLYNPVDGQLLLKLEPADRLPSIGFGYAVAGSEDRMLVGALYDDCDDGQESGSAYLFDAAGSQIAKLTASEPGPSQYYGAAVAMEGGLALIGAPAPETLSTGAAYVIDAATGEELAKITPSDGVIDAGFGRALAMAGTIALISARGDDDQASNAGAVYVYDLSDPASPVELSKFYADDPGVLEVFGESVAVSGTTAVVGATRDAELGYRAGAAYVFDLSDPTNPMQVHKLLGTGNGGEEEFGIDVAISDDGIVVVGAWKEEAPDFNSGAAYVFDAATGARIAKLSPSDPNFQDRFGCRVAIQGAMVAVGALWDDDAGFQAGATYLFELPSACPDLNADSVVDTHDLNQLLADFNCSDLDCPGDLNQDGVVNTRDLNLLLVAFGSTCL